MALDEPDGLLAFGGDLHPERLIRAYRQGIFPWYSEDQPLLWWSPRWRAVLEPESLRLSRRLARTLRQQRFRLSADTAFDEVIDGCAAGRPDQQGTWITADMRRAYVKLHQRGVAHSIEAWYDGKLAGGLYGLQIGRVFFGESMFSDERDASKVILAHLCRQLAEWGFPFLDCQVINPHLERLGAREMERSAFLAILSHHVDRAPPSQSLGEAMGRPW